eukprot:952887-Pyramimonas_sp.AAC.1
MSPGQVTSAQGAPSTGGGGALGGAGAQPVLPDNPNPNDGSIEGATHRGYCGTVDGEQSVPAAEHAAFFWALMLASGPITIYTDCQQVANG